MTQRVMPLKSTVIGTARAFPETKRDAPVVTRTSVAIALDAVNSASSSSSAANLNTHAPEPCN